MRVWGQLDFATSLRTTTATGAAINDDNDVAHSDEPPNANFPRLHALTMSTTTAILFNSPALHSLKRDQLVKLCKIHSLKANGKNVELIERLKAKASELPEEALVWHDSEDEAELAAKLDAMVSPTPAVRPSEQWEMVMDDIEEEDETSSNANTLRSMKSVRTIGAAGEFGTGPSKRTFQCTPPLYPFKPLRACVISSNSYLQPL